MRKNFLLLFLMALLPLAGWADAPTISLSKTQYTYIGGSMETAVRAKLTITGTYDDVRFYNAATTSEVTPINAGSYYVRAANGGDWSDPVYFQIMPKDLELTATQIEIRYGEYGADLPDGYYTVSGFVGSDDIYDVTIEGVKASSAAAEAAHGAAGSYPYNLSIAGATTSNPNYSLKVIGTGSTLTINKVPLTITTENKAKVYGNVDPEFTATYVGFVNGEDASVLTDLEITRVAGEDVGTYAISVTATSSNYEITLVNSGSLTISQRSIDATNLAITGVDPNGYTYTGQPIQPTFVVKDMSLGEEGTVLVAGTDYTVGWYENTNAGEARFKIKPVTTSNFTFDNTNKYFTINKAPLTLSTVAKEKTYGAADPTFEVAGTGFVNNETVAVLTGLTFERETGEGVGTYVISVATVDAANYEITLDTENNGSLTISQATLNAKVKNQNIVFGAAIPDNVIEYVDGIVGTDVFADVVDLTNVAYAYKQGANFVANPVNVGEYTITATGATAANYNVIIANGTLNINKATAYIIPEAKSKKYGQTDPELTWTVQDADGQPLANSVLNGSVELARQNGNAVGTYTIYVKGYNVAVPDNDNYAVGNTMNNPESTAGTNKTAIFTISQDATNTLKLKFKEGTVAQKVYDGTTTVPYDKDDLEVVEGLAGTDTWETLKPAATASFILASKDTYAENNQVTVEITGLTNYANVVVEPLAFEVTKKPLSIEVANQTLDYGAALGQGTDKWALASGYTLGVGDALSAVGINLYTVDAEDARKDILEFAPGATYEDAILAEIPEGTTTNYSVASIAIAGDLTINTALAIILNRPNKAAWTADNSLDNAATVIAAASAAKYTTAQANAANAGVTGAWQYGTQEKTHDPLVYYTDAEVTEHNAAIEGAVTINDAAPFNVTFGDFEMYAEKWYPIVLPFATSVKEVSEAFGYAIVNILNENNTDASKIAFKLHMKDIPANTPFVVKAYEDINMNTVTFVKKQIENSAAPEVSDLSGVKFIGSYSHKVGFTENEAFFSASATKNDYYWGPSANMYMAPLAAYFQTPVTSAARNIEFEEADGSTTAIEIVGAEKTVQSNEGWYTINGVKLEAAPTQKGIYIKDGKKVVLK